MGTRVAFAQSVCHAHGWNNVVNGVRLSDHGRTLVSLEIESRDTDVL